MSIVSTGSVYLHVVEDVLNKVREEFVGDSGPGEAVLTQLQAMWEAKLMSNGVLLGPIDRSSAQKWVPGGPTPVHDLNLPYEGTEEYETPTVEMLFPPTPLQNPVQTPLPGTADNSMFGFATGQSGYSENNELKYGRPYMIFLDESSNRSGGAKAAMGERKLPQMKDSLSRIPQLDGPISDPYNDKLSTPNIYNYQGAVKEDYDAVIIPAPMEDEDEDPLNENDDDDEDLDDADEGEELKTQHLILAQFDRVCRTKSKWKCTLKDGIIMHKNGNDILFNKATGEFEF